VEGRGGRVAITCDGANEHPPERLSQELEREAVLERLGWKFLRARASGYYLDPEKTIARVLERNEELELEPPDPGEAPEEESRGEELRQRVMARAEELLREWGVSAGEEGEAAPSARPSRASSIAERLEKKIKKIRLLSGEESKAKKEGDEDDSEDSAEDSGETRRGKRLTGWRNLLPLQKPASRKTGGGTSPSASKKSGYFIPIDKKAKPGSKKTDNERDEKSADGE
ncbi:MAG: hypothetical protein KC910_22905, partial [Candidatus Eremiobacteraeota bacterium]|nr:hypothetical protein [Candidatus Eremiobacteraeota bacterium]